MGLKHWILSKIILRHTYSFFYFWVGRPFSAWILVRSVCQTFKALKRGHLKCVSCCTTKYFELGTVFHVAQLNIWS